MSNIKIVWKPAANQRLVAVVGETEVATAEPWGEDYRTTLNFGTQDKVLISTSLPTAWVVERYTEHIKAKAHA